MKILGDFIFRVASGAVTKSKIRAPWLTGNLNRDIQVISHNETSATIGNTKITPYAPFVHFGTKPHIIRPKNKKVLANRKTGRIFGKKVNHPGTRANPYLINGINDYFKSSDFRNDKKFLAENIKKKALNTLKKGVK